MSYLQFPINNPKVYVTTQKRTDHDLDGTWITLPVDDLDEVLSSLDLKHIEGNESYIITDYESVSYTHLRAHET